MSRPLEIQVKDGFAQLGPDVDPASIEPVVARAERPLRLQFDEPLPDAVLAATARVLERHPEVVFRAYGRRVDPSLTWLSGFEHVQHLVLHLWEATSFNVLAEFRALRSLSLGETASKQPSLAFLRQLPLLEVLRVEGHARDFDAVGELSRLERLHLRVTRVKSLDALRGHPALQVLTMDFGSIRDISPLADLPMLRGLQLYQVRKLDTDDLDALGSCRGLEAVSLGALRNVSSLRALARGPASTLRFLILERLTTLLTLADLASCQQLEQLGLYESRPADRRLDVLLTCPGLRHLVVGDSYPKDQFEALRRGFAGETLQLRGESVRGDLAKVAVRWRAPVHSLLAAAT